MFNKTISKKMFSIVILKDCNTPRKTLGEALRSGVQDL